MELWFWSVFFLLGNSWGAEDYEISWDLNLWLSETILLYRMIDISKANLFWHFLCWLVKRHFTQSGNKLPTNFYLKIQDVRAYVSHTLTMTSKNHQANTIACCSRPLPWCAKPIPLCRNAPKICLSCYGGTNFGNSGTVMWWFWWAQKFQQKFDNRFPGIRDILLMVEIPNNHLGCRKPCEWDKLPINWCGICSINSILQCKFLVKL